MNKYPKIFSDALKLPTGEYYTPKLAKIRDEEVMLVGMNSIAITNATSLIPVIGTDSFDPCYALILYNTKTKTAILTHKPFPDRDEFTTLLERVRTNTSDQIDVHIIGTPKIASDFHIEGLSEIIKNDSFAESQNKLAVSKLTSLLEQMHGHQNVTLKTFDVYNKPKTSAVLIDTRNGKLIRGTKLFRGHEEGLGLENHFYYNEMENWQDFDGTLPELQNQKRR